MSLSNAKKWAAEMTRLDIIEWDREALAEQRRQEWVRQNEIDDIKAMLKEHREKIMWKMIRKYLKRFLYGPPEPEPVTLPQFKRQELCTQSNRQMLYWSVIQNPEDWSLEASTKSLRLGIDVTLPPPWAFDRHPNLKPYIQSLFEKSKSITRTAAKPAGSIRKQRSTTSVSSVKCKPDRQISADLRSGQRFRRESSFNMK